MSEISEAADLERVLRSTRTVAVLGAHPDPQKPAHFVPAYLHEQGYRVLPVNPKYPDTILWDAAPVARLADLDEPVDVVDVFRRSTHLPAHLDDILAMDPLPAVVWLQQGVRHDEVARALGERGIEVVQDACMMALHKKFGLQGVPGR